VGKRALDAKLVAVMMSTLARLGAESGKTLQMKSRAMMSTHTRLGAESGLKVFDDPLVTLICDLVCRDSKASSLFGKDGVFVTDETPCDDVDLVCRNSKASSLFGKDGVFACPGNHHLETCVVTDETPSSQSS
jgi:hypothetical protein